MYSIAKSGYVASVLEHDDEKVSLSCIRSLHSLENNVPYCLFGQCLLVKLKHESILPVSV